VNTPFSSPPAERGAALLAVLLLVAVMASLSAVALEKMTLAARTAGNAAALEQARAFALGAESYAVLRIGDLVRLSPERTTLRGGWHGNPIRIPLPTGTATAVVTDGGNCFNLNGVVQTEPFAAAGAPPRYVASSRGMSQLAGLLRVTGTPTNEADAVAGALADWIDSDDAPGPAGAEDSAYAALAYTPPNRLVVDPTELRAVLGVTPAIFASVKPWLCALPTATPSPINVNTLTPEQAPLLAMLLPGQLGVDGARNLLARRPPDGWPSSDAFWDEPAVQALAAAPDTRAQIVEKTRWFRLRLDVELDGAQVEEDALIDAGSVPARLVSRTWGQD